MGLDDYGYEFVIVDDCWQDIQRASDNHLMEDSKTFPKGIRYLSDEMHERDLKLGISASAGYKTCQKRPGSHNYESIDA